MSEDLWLRCKEKTCCYASLVTVSGRDVWHIARTLGTDPWTFLLYFAAPEPQPDGFYLDISGKQYRLALAKGKTRRTKSPPPCLFLLKTRDKEHRCGLGEDRPQVCRTFPTETQHGLITIDQQTGCTCRAWSLTDVNMPEAAVRHQSRRRDYFEYTELVALWNESVMQRPDDAAPVDFFQYCNFIMRAYDSQQTTFEMAALG